jgi:hypothetical protein
MATVTTPFLQAGCARRKIQVIIGDQEIFCIDFLIVKICTNAKTSLFNKNGCHGKNTFVPKKTTATDFSGNL